MIASDLNLLTRSRIDGGDDPSFIIVPVIPYSGNGIARVLNWVSYAVVALVAALRSGRADVVYASSPHLLAGLTGVVLAMIWRVPLVVEVRDLWPKMLVEMGTMSESSPIYRALHAVETLLYRRASLIVILAEGSRRYIEEQGVPSDRIVFVPNGADTADFIVDEDRDSLRREAGFSGFVVIYTGAHGPANGLDLVLDAAAKVATTSPEVRFVLVGDGVEKPALVERARREGITNVEFRDPVAKRAIPRLLAAADAGLHVLADVDLFRYGVSPNKLFDYLAAGLPVVTNTGGDVASIVEESGAGWAVAPTAIADGASQAAREPRSSLLDRGVAGRHYLEANFSRSASARRLEESLSSLVRPRT